MLQVSGGRAGWLLMTERVATYGMDAVNGTANAVIVAVVTFL
jgi:hypothetical protein